LSKWLPLSAHNGEFLKILWWSVEDRKDETIFRFVFKLTFNINYIQVQADSKLPVLYLIDSVMKNIGQPYTPLFVQNIEKLFASTFIKVNIILYFFNFLSKMFSI